MYSVARSCQPRCLPCPRPSGWFFVGPAWANISALLPMRRSWARANAQVREAEGSIGQLWPSGRHALLPCPGLLLFEQNPITTPGLCGPDADSRLPLTWGQVCAEGTVDKREVQHDG